MTYSMIRLAKKQANNSTYIYKLGAVITKGNRVLSTGFNQINHCKVNNFNNSRHAEMDAIMKLMRYELHKLAGSSLYVTRITAKGKTAMARPCAKCIKLAKSVGIREIIYTTDTTTVKEKI